MTFSLRKRGCYLLLFLLFSCSTPPCHWNFHTIDSECSRFDSSRLSSIQSDHHQLQVEFIHNCYGVWGYLNLTRGQLKPHPKHPLSIHARFAGHEEPLSGYLLEGGQRILLSPQSAQKLLFALHSNEQVLIFIEGYEGEFHPVYFPPATNKLPFPLPSLGF